MRRADRRAMSSDHDPIHLRELSLGELDPTSPSSLRAPFLALHVAWVSRGAGRWLDLVHVDGPHPIVVFGAFIGSAPERLVGAVVGVWGPAPIDRFDDLFEGGTGPASSRPLGGAWHMIAVTTSPSHELRGMGVGRLLLGRALSWARAGGHEVVRTLSPAIGLPELAARWPRGADDAIARSCRADGKPVLQVMRLHLGGGAALERVLHASRSDDAESGHVTLRFIYPTDVAQRTRRLEALRRWYDRRAALIGAGRAEVVGRDLFRVETPDDATFVPDPTS